MRMIRNTILCFAMLWVACISMPGCTVKIDHAKTGTYKVYGNCGMCKKKIEKSININGQAKGVWDKKTKLVVITYDSTQTDADHILRRVADAGYDNEKFLADAAVYNKLHTCCRYKRSAEASK